jgi:LPXTG-site transpeptidase (sortase) family protein
MLQNRSISPALLVLLGIIFLTIGFAGIYFINQPVLETPENSRYRYYEKIRQDNKLIYFPTPESIAQTQTFQITDPGELIKLGKTDVHDPLNPALEIPKIPDKLEIPAINLIAPITISDYNHTNIEGETFGQWVAPSEFAAGWHPDSALLGQTGNVVINGHHNEFGLVFGDLINLKIGDIIKVYFKDEVYTYVISNKLILPERFQEASVRLGNARWLAKTDDTRLTLVTCWPKESNTHRLIIVARPY